jgi:hypothetical protein
MANQAPIKTQHAQKIPKFRLQSLFTDAEVSTVPAEPAKIVVAGLAAADVKFDYPEGSFKKALAVFGKQKWNLLKSSLFFILATVPFILVLTLALKLMQDDLIAKGFYFMSDIGVGYQSASPDIHGQVLASMYWDVVQPVLMMAALAAIIASPFMGGLGYCAKRCYFQNNYKRFVRTFFMGVAKLWWKYLIICFFGIMVTLAMGTAIMYFLQQQALGTLSAAAYCAVVFSFVLGAPMLIVPFTALTILPTYNLTLWQTIKNSIVIIANNPIVTVIAGVISAAPLLLLIPGMIFSIIVYAIMALVGFSFVALMWVSIGDRGMTKCKLLKAYEDKKNAPIVGKTKKAKGEGATAYQGNPTQKKSGNKKPQQHYVNPKKKKNKK